MNVLFLSESRGWSGGAKQLLALAEGLRRDGWRMLIACPPDGETFRKAGELGFQTLAFHPRQDYDLISAIRLAAKLSKSRIDVLHAHHPRAHAVGLMAVHLSRRRPLFLVTRRVSFPPPGHVFSRMKYLSPRIDAYVAVAESIRSILIQAGVPPGRVETIPSGVDLQEYAPRPRDRALAGELGLPAATPVLGLVANVGSWKGQDVFLAAAAGLKARGVRAIVLFAGRDTDSAEFRARAARAGLGDEDARFLGFRRDMPRVLSLLDVSVNASTAGEGLSGALRESLAMGIPVAASDVGGNRELVTDRATGRLFEPANHEALARALEEMLADSEGSRRMAAAGRGEVLRRFGLEPMVRATAGLYRRLLSRVPPVAEPFEHAA